MNLSKEVQKSFKEWFTMPLNFSNDINRIIKDIAFVSYRSGVLKGIELEESRANKLT